MDLLITGGAGFVGAALATAFRENSAFKRIVVMDNLHRRGSELNLARFRRLGIEFIHGDIREAHDLQDIPGTFDVIIESSAEPSVLAGNDGSPRYVIETNLGGSINCLELARNTGSVFVFLSSSRVYSIEPLNHLALKETDVRFELDENQTITGAGPSGISERFPTDQFRSIYGATKLASELLIQEYAHQFGMPAVINRCGIIAGAGQFGKVDQGVISHWVLSHYFKQPLSYMGFGGKGKQVRDLMHPLDLFDLINKQIEVPDKMRGEIFNVGGGRASSLSLLELTNLCREITGNEVQIDHIAETNQVDIPYYVSDLKKVKTAFDWKSSRTPRQIISEIYDWISGTEDELRNLLMLNGVQ